jgi:hypothetical protein
MPYQIKVDDVYLNENGASVRIICTNRRGYPYSVVGLIDKGTHEIAQYYKNEGTYSGAASGEKLILPESYDDWQIDDPIWVWDDCSVNAVPRHFAGTTDNGRVIAWSHGTTSHSTQKMKKPTVWEHASKTDPRNSK